MNLVHSRLLDSSIEAEWLSEIWSDTDAIGMRSSLLMFLANLAASTHDCSSSREVVSELEGDSRLLPIKK